MESRMTKGELIFALCYFPVHILILPFLIDRMITCGQLNETNGNLAYYAIGFLVLVAAEIRFLRRDYDTLCDSLLKNIFQVFLCYLTMMAMNFCISGLLSMAEYLLRDGTAEGNLNNSAIMEMANTEYGKMAAIGIFLAPFSEELMFRGALFGTLRRKNRIIAYAVSMLAFSVYHVWAYAMMDPVYWIYVLEYLPASFALCLCYERTDTIWAPIAMHMLVNGVALKALTALEELF